MSIRKTTATNGKTRSAPKELAVTDMDDDDDEGMAFVFYGRSGTGKTTLAADFEKPMLYIDCRDKGGKSIRDVKGIKKFKVTEFAQFEEAYWWLKQNPQRYRTVVIDTVSQLQAMYVAEFGAKKKNKSGRKVGDWGTLSQRDWGDIAAHLKEWLGNYRDLVEEGMDVVFIAQDRTFNMSEDDEDEETLAPEIGPGLSPSVAKSLNASVDLIGNTFIRSTWKEEKNAKGKVIREAEVIDFCLRIGPNSLYVTKVRKPKHQVAPALIVDPSYDDILDVINGDYKNGS